MVENPLLIHQNLPTRQDYLKDINKTKTEIAKSGTWLEKAVILTENFDLVQHGEKPLFTQKAINNIGESISSDEIKSFNGCITIYVKCQEYIKFLLLHKRVYEESLAVFTGLLRMRKSIECIRESLQEALYRGDILNCNKEALFIKATPNDDIVLLPTGQFKLNVDSGYDSIDSKIERYHLICKLNLARLKAAIEPVVDIAYKDSNPRWAFLPKNMYKLVTMEEIDFKYADDTKENPEFYKTVLLKEGKKDFIETMTVPDYNECEPDQETLDAAYKLLPSINEEEIVWQI
jgi:hypothetical protein